MAEWAAITVLGQDRPGIVAGVTQALFEHGCNLEDSSATRLRDAFAMILVARLPEPADLPGLREALVRCAGELDVNIDLRELGRQAPLPPPEGDRYLLAVYGADQAGIVYHVAAELADLGCNIEDVTTRIAGTSDQPVYIMMLEMTVPPTVAPGSIDDRMGQLRDRLNVDISLREIESETL